MLPRVNISDAPLGLSHWWSVFRRRRMLILAIVVMFAGAAVVFSSLSATTYTATAELLIGTDSANQFLGPAMQRPDPTRG